MLDFDFGKFSIKGLQLRLELQRRETLKELGTEKKMTNENRSLQGEEDLNEGFSLKGKQAFTMI